MCAPLLFHSNLSTLYQGNATARSPGGIASFGYSADVVLVEPGPGRIQCASALTSSEGEGSEAVKLQWESDGTSYSATGGSGHRYEIVVLYHATEWGVKGTRRGWCLKANDQVSHFHKSLGQCKKAASLLEKRALLF